MVLQETEIMVQTVLSETILTACRKNLPYQVEFSVEGMLHIIVDKKEVFLVNIKDTIQKIDEPPQPFEPVPPPLVEPPAVNQSAGQHPAGQPPAVDASAGQSSTGKPKKEPVESDEKPKRGRGRPRKSKAAVKYYESEEDDFEMGGEEVDDDDYVQPKVNITGAFPNMQCQINDTNQPIKEELPSTSYDMTSSVNEPNPGTYTTEQLHDLALQLAAPSQHDASSGQDGNTAVTDSIHECVKTEPLWDQKMMPPSVENEQTFACDICGKAFGAERHLKRHVRSHVLSGRHSCDYCNYSSYWRNNYLRHVKNHHPEKYRKTFNELQENQNIPKGPYTCNDCGETVEKHSEFKKHMIRHGASPYLCDICGKGFKLTKTLQTHKMIHTGEKPYPCEECEKTFRQKSHLRNHQAKHAKRRAEGASGAFVVSQDRPLSCDQCEKGFCDEASLKSHQRLMHQLKGKFACHLCDYKSNWKRNFHRHLQSKHSLYYKQLLLSGEISNDRPKGPFVCETCGKVDKHYSLHVKHVQTHSGERPYLCDHCGKGFPTRGNLSVHERQHTGEKPFVCQFCDRRFPQKKALHIHERTHTGEKPFTCSFCGRCFADESNLRTHEKKLHGKERPSRRNKKLTEISQGQSEKEDTKTLSPSKTVLLSPEFSNVPDFSFSMLHTL